MSDLQLINNDKTRSELKSRTPFSGSAMTAIWTIQRAGRLLVDLQCVLCAFARVRLVLIVRLRNVPSVHCVHRSFSSIDAPYLSPLFPSMHPLTCRS